jgi:hypothetical protein
MVAEAFCFSDDPLNEGSAKAGPSMLVTDEQSFHLAHPVSQFLQRNAPGRLIPNIRQKKATGRRCIIAGQVTEFLVEVLEAKVDTQGGGILAEQCPNRLHLLGRTHYADGSSYRHRQASLFGFVSREDLHEASRCKDREHQGAKKESMQTLQGGLAHHAHFDRPRP